MNILICLTGFNIFVLGFSILLSFRANSTLKRAQGHTSSIIEIILKVRDELEEINVMLEDLFDELTGEYKTKHEGTI